MRIIQPAPAAAETWTVERLVIFTDEANATESGGELEVGPDTWTVQNSGNGTAAVVDEGLRLDPDAGDYLDNTNTNALGVKISLADLLGEALPAAGMVEVTLLFNAVNPSSGRQGVHLGVGSGKGIDEANAYGPAMSYVATSGEKVTGAFFENGNRGPAATQTLSAARVLGLRAYAEGGAEFLYGTTAGAFDDPDSLTSLANGAMGNAPSVARIFDITNAYICVYAGDDLTVDLEQMRVRVGR